MSDRSAAGVVAGNEVRRSFGSLEKIRPSVSATDSPSNARRPVSISCSTTPKAQMSARLSAGRPLACSGDMYAAVPRIMPICVARLVSVGEFDGDISPCAPSPSVPPAMAFASPKSRTLAVPSARILMLAGFRSR